ncbi:hypothetical protein NDU88_006456 [Pleurodeles waltl]|uniref:Secreted protein n=1 Tax=Pleurodeles waltl TaxID=8319 RepID=A0AAV7NQT3_PLEWA|nr:hypothetical protein NDU88_006456 [Pleurodeles waltl]
MLQGHLMGDLLSQLSLLFQVLYPVCAPRPAQTEPRPEGFAPGRQLAQECLLVTSRSRGCAAFPPSALPPLHLSRWERGRSSEVATILVPRSRQRDTLFSAQPLFVVHWRFHRICQADFCSLERSLPLVFGAWRCYYFGWAPFAAPERRARRAASSAAGHAPCDTII